MTESTGEEFVGKKLAVALGAALLLGFAVVIAVAAYDQSRLATLESVDKPRAVGDSNLSPDMEKIDPEYLKIHPAVK